jgi:hypothetical protein
MRFPPVVRLFACALMLAPLVFAQSPNGVINGLVADPSSRTIVGADIVIVNDLTRVKYTTKTNAEGIYVLPNLPPGPYRLQVSKIGFKTIIKPDITLNVQDALSINFTLPIGALYETVTVEGGAPLINTTDASVTTVVDETYVKNMPLNGRSFQDLILLTPGIITQTPQSGASFSLGTRGEFSVDGQRPESNYYTVDGVSANVGVSFGSISTSAGFSGSLPASTAVGGTQALVSVDDLQEFRVQSSSYSAEYGRNPGGQFAFDTKSGTNQWHGAAYDYLRNGALDSQDWFSNYFGVRQPALRQNDFGGTFGGPVEIPGLYDGKNKTFFFVSYEGLRLAAPQPAVASAVPDLCMRGVGICPAGREPGANALQPVLNAFPLPSSSGLADAADGLGQFIGSWSNASSVNSTSVRFDHTVSDKLRLFFRFGGTPSSSATRRPSASTTPPTLVDTDMYSLRTYTAGASTLLSSRLGNEFRLNYTSNDVTDHLDIRPLGGSSPLNLLRLAGLGPDSSSLVLFVLGSTFLALAQGPTRGTQSQWNLIDTVSFSLGRHQMKFGVDFRRLTPSNVPASLSAEYDFLSESTVELNTAFGFFQRSVTAYPLYENSSVFAQDEWKLSRRLTLSLGLRWDVNPAPSTARGQQPYTLIQTGTPNTWTLAKEGTPLWRTTWYNFAPRLGVAYVLRKSPRAETVVRGGGGVFFDTGQQLGNVSFAGPGFTAIATPTLSFPGNPDALTPPIVNPPVSGFPVIQAPTPHLQLPYTLQWNTSVEQALGKSQSLGVFYVGSHAGRLLRLTEFQSVTNPLASLFFIAQNGLTSDYGSLQLQYRRRLSNGLTALASYTWSHCLDYGSQNYTFGYQRGNCDFDVRHNFSAAISYDLPSIRENRFARAVLDHWGLDNRVTVHSAFPVTLDGNALLQPNGQFFYAGLDLVPGQPVYLHGANCDSTLRGLHDLNPTQTCPGGRAINPLAFTNASSGLGDAPRNFARGFGAWQMNSAVRREFPIHERLRLRFRAEAFNIFNHPNFGTIDPVSGDLTFGQATSTLANSLGILNPLYQMGGPRSMQFSLKAIF